MATVEYHKTENALYKIIDGWDGYTLNRAVPHWTENSYVVKKVQGWGGDADTEGPLTEEEAAAWAKELGGSL